MLAMTTLSWPPALVTCFPTRPDFLTPPQCCRPATPLTHRPTLTPPCPRRHVWQQRSWRPQPRSLAVGPWRAATAAPKRASWGRNRRAGYATAPCVSASHRVSGADDEAPCRLCFMAPHAADHWQQGRCRGEPKGETAGYPLERMMNHGYPKSQNVTERCTGHSAVLGVDGFGICGGWGDAYQPGKRFGGQYHAGR
jgi:hypothetical protein